MQTFYTNEPGRSGESLPIRGLLIAKTYTGKADIQLVHTVEFGEVLLMNNEIQSSATDQEFYHAKLVSLAVREGARNIFIFGGGEGCTAQVAFKAAPQAMIQQCDYDLGAMMWCDIYLRHWNKGVYNNPRLQVIAADALEVNLPLESADAVLIDLFDYTPETESFMIKVLQKSASALRPGGRCAAYLGDDTASLREFICRLQISAIPYCKITYSLAYFPSYGSLNSVFLVMEKL
jgi:spermidine synthase